MTSLTEVIESDGPRRVQRRHFHQYEFACSDCGVTIECAHRHDAQDLMDTHHCEDVQ